MALFHWHLEPVVGVDPSPFPVQDEERVAVHHPNSLSCQRWDEPGLHLQPWLSAGECDGGVSPANG